jgi:hypothetical protein
MRSNVFRLARYLGAQGWSQADIASHLETYHGDVRAQERGNAAVLGARWGSRIRLDQDLNPTGRMQRSWMMRNQYLPLAYRYTVLVPVLAGGGFSGGFRTIVIDSGKQLNYPDIWALAEATFQAIAPGSESMRYNPIDPEGEMQILLAERRSG